MCKPFVQIFCFFYFNLLLSLMERPLNRIYFVYNSRGTKYASVPQERNDGNEDISPLSSTSERYKSFNFNNWDMCFWRMIWWKKYSEEIKTFLLTLLNFVNFCGWNDFDGLLCWKVIEYKYEWRVRPQLKPYWLCSILILFSRFRKDWYVFGLSHTACNFAVIDHQVISISIIITYR